MNLWGRLGLLDFLLSFHDIFPEVLANVGIVIVVLKILISFVGIPCIIVAVGVRNLLSRLSIVIHSWLVLWDSGLCGLVLFIGIAIVICAAGSCIEVSALAHVWIHRVHRLSSVLVWWILASSSLLHRRLLSLVLPHVVTSALFHGITVMVHVTSSHWMYLVISAVIVVVIEIVRYRHAFCTHHVWVASLLVVVSLIAAVRLFHWLSLRYGRISLIPSVSLSSHRVWRHLVVVALVVVWRWCMASVAALEIVHRLTLASTLRIIVF